MNKKVFIILMDNIINNYIPVQTLITNDPDNENIINRHINKIYVINLKVDKLRATYINILLNKLKINYELIQVIRPSQKVYNQVIKLSKPLSKKMTVGEVGCYLSHMWCLQNMIKNNYKKAIIFEDDIVVHKNYKLLFEQIVMKNDYDFLMLGAADHGFNNGNKELIKDNIYIPKNHVIMGTHAIYYSQHGASIIYDYRLKNPVYFDKNLKELFTFFDENKTGVCSPNLFTVENSTSNLGHNFGIVKYKYNDYYYNDCYENFDFTHYHFIYLDLFTKFMLESPSKIKVSSKEDIMLALLKNYFNNDEELSKFHLAKLDSNFLTIEEYNTLLKVAKNPFIQLYYKDYLQYCSKTGITPGKLLHDKISREQINSIINKKTELDTQLISLPKIAKMKKKFPYLFTKYILEPSIKKEKIEYEIINTINFQKNFVAHLHCFNIDNFDEIYGLYMETIDKHFDIIITYSQGTPLKKHAKYIILKVPNKGLDIGAKFIAINYLKKNKLYKHTYILFLHSKTCSETRKIYFDSLINGLPYIINKIETSTNKIGGFFPPTIHKGDDTPIIYDQKYLAKEILDNCLYDQATINKPYLNELIDYFELPHNDITLFCSGNCYMLDFNIAIKLYGNKKLYNVLNNESNNNKIKCFDYNWVKTYYNIQYNEIDYIYEAYDQFNLYGNNLQLKDKTKYFANGMIEHSFERIIFQVITNYKPLMQIQILPNNKNSNQILELSEQINLCYTTKKY